MPRRNRLDYPGIPQHLVHRGNNRRVTFFHDEDREHYADMAIRFNPVIDLSSKMRVKFKELSGIT